MRPAACPASSSHTSSCDRGAGLGIVVCFAGNLLSLWAELPSPVPRSCGVSPLRRDRRWPGTITVQRPIPNCDENALYAVVRPGCVYAWLCTSATVEVWRVAGHAGPPARLGNRPTPVNGCPRRMLQRAGCAADRCPSSSRSRTSRCVVGMSRVSRSAAVISAARSRTIRQPA